MAAVTMTRPASPRIFRAGRWPPITARVGGTWHSGLLLRRYDWSPSLSTAVVWMTLPAPDGWDGLARYSRHYVWGPETIRLHQAGE